ncbi:hypothetical protein NEMBOFW57_010290 [Staphylotrichum longicolle]|uniref:Uncharacterized protein n=1 Tax=Staphylotrichum longicolle TaxID=669026 RepID=A0AAD4EML0_9PEZI|nr:hypothetical protein NEMBOFW57_010290 [Staphylotrichum longicolle]
MPSANGSAPQGFTALSAKPGIQEALRGVKRLEPVDVSDDEGGKTAHSSPFKKKKRKKSSKKKEKRLAELAGTLHSRVPLKVEPVQATAHSLMPDPAMEYEPEADGPAPTPTPSPVSSSDGETLFVRRAYDSSPITYPTSSDDEGERPPPTPTPTRAPAIVYGFADETAAADENDTASVAMDEFTTDVEEVAVAELKEVAMVDAMEAEEDAEVEEVEDQEVKETEEVEEIKEAKEVQAMDAEEGPPASATAPQPHNVASDSDMLVAFLLGFLAGFVNERNATHRLVAAIRAEIDRLKSRAPHPRRRRLNALNLHWRLVGMRLVFQTFKGDYDAIAARLEVLEQNHEALKVKVKRLRNRTQRDMRSQDTSIEYHTECLNKVHEAHEAATGAKLW